MTKFTLLLQDGQPASRPLYYKEDLKDNRHVYDAWDFDLNAARWFDSIAEALGKAKEIHGRHITKFRKREKVYVINEQRQPVRTFKRA